MKTEKPVNDAPVGRVVAATGISRGRSMSQPAVTELRVVVDGFEVRINATLPVWVTKKLVDVLKAGGLETEAAMKQPIG